MVSEALLLAIYMHGASMAGTNSANNACVKAQPTHVELSIEATKLNKEWHLVTCEGITSGNEVFVSDIIKTKAGNCKYTSLTKLKLKGVPAEDSEFLTLYFFKSSDGVCPGYFSDKYFQISGVHNSNQSERVFMEASKILTKLRRSKQAAVEVLSSIPRSERLPSYNYQEFVQDLNKSRKKRNIQAGGLVKMNENHIYSLSLHLNGHSWMLFLSYSSQETSVVGVGMLVL